VIRHLALRNWRAYRVLTLTFGEGTTFVVAPNGVGKSSLLEAAAWALFGGASGVDAASAVRAGETNAVVELTVASDAGELRVKRSVDQRGRVALRASLGERVLEDDRAYVAALEAAFGAPLSVAARLTFLTDKGDLSSAAGEFPIRDHLATVFGVRDLLIARDAATQHRKAAERDREALRAVAKRDDAALEAHRRELEDVAVQISAAEEVYRDVLGRVAEAQRRQEAARRWAAYRQEVERRERELAEASASLRRVLGEEAPDGDVGDAIPSVEDKLAAALERSRSESAGAAARAETVEAALDELSSAAGICPTCLRPLEDADVERALAQHRDHHARLQADIERSERVVEELRAKLTALHELARQVASLPAPDPPDVEPPADTESTGPEVERAQEEQNEAADRLERLRVRLQLLTEELAQAEAARSARRDQVVAFRREALAEAARLALDETARHLMAEGIVPLTAEVAHRWKRLFGTGGGLRVSPEGRITMEINGHRLSFSDLSGGERMSALLVTRLLVLTASTRAGFAWLDEPLEHLDPTRRQTMAVALAKATRSSQLRQLVVTTYEEGLARQLAASANDVTLSYVRSHPLA